MPHGGNAPSAAVPTTPVLTKPGAEHGRTPLVVENGTDANERAVYEAVNNQGDRISQIIRQREQDKQLGADLREQREASAQARADREGTPAIPTGATSSESIETLAARMRAQSKEPPKDASKPPTQQPSANEQVTSWDETHLATPQTQENGDFGDASPGRRLGSMQGSVSAPVEVQRVPAAGSPSVGRTPGNVGAGIDPLLALQEQYLSRVNDQPKNLAAQLELQLTRLLRNEPVPSMPDLSALAGEDRELLAAVSDALANFRNLVRNDPNPLGSEKARPFVEMADRIRARTDLSVGSVNLCTSVKAFGNYEPIEPLQFVAGNPTWSVFYCEVDGFLSQLNEKQLWESKLSLELRLYNEAGMQLWRNSPETVSDTTRKRRRDFFIAKRIQLPSKLAPGPYMLKATIRDLQANRVAESTLQVSILGR